MLCFVNAGESDACTIAAFIPFQKEAYTLSTAGRVMHRVTSVKFGVVRVCCGNFENKTNCHNWKVSASQPLTWAQTHEQLLELSRNFLVRLKITMQRR